MLLDCGGGGLGCVLGVLVRFEFVTAVLAVLVGAARGKERLWGRKDS